MYWYYICDKFVKHILYFCLMNNNYSHRLIKNSALKDLTNKVFILHLRVKLIEVRFC